MEKGYLGIEKKISVNVLGQPGRIVYIFFRKTVSLAVPHLIARFANPFKSPQKSDPHPDHITTRRRACREGAEMVIPFFLLPLPRFY
jgi:hypothetical protein